MKESLTQSTGILYSLLGFVIFFHRLTEFIEYNNTDISDLQFEFLILFLSIILLISNFTILAKYVNFCCLWIITLISFYNSYNPWYSISLTFIIGILVFKYTIIKKSLIFKVLSSLLVFITICVLIFTFFNNKIRLTSIIPTLIFFILTITIAKNIFMKEYANVKHKEKICKDELKISEMKNEDMNSYLRKINIDYIDPIKAGLTKTEMTLLKNLCLYKESNAYLAARLGKSPNTIKVQLPKIMSKIGVDNRYQLIDQCKYYFIDTKNIKNN